ncbi:hypothetical protein O181_125239, partial [Austropuccinia psidii MF-1]|nr:hypothetical protein [Austropuccinia psidii MF-1]
MTAPNLFRHLTPPRLQVPLTIYNLPTSPMSFLIIVSFLNHYYFFCTFSNLLNSYKPQQTMNPSTIASEAPSVDNKTMFQSILNAQEKLISSFSILQDDVNRLKIGSETPKKTQLKSPKLKVDSKIPERKSTKSKDYRRAQSEPLPTIPTPKKQKETVSPSSSKDTESKKRHPLQMQEKDYLLEFKGVK